LLLGRVGRCAGSLKVGASLSSVTVGATASMALEAVVAGVAVEPVQVATTTGTGTAAAGVALVGRVLLLMQPWGCQQLRQWMEP
jgi:hypothetical protein